MIYVLTQLNTNQFLKVQSPGDWYRSIHRWKHADAYLILFLCDQGNKALRSASNPGASRSPFSSGDSHILSVLMNV